MRYRFFRLASEYFALDYAPCLKIIVLFFPGLHAAAIVPFVVILTGIITQEVGLLDYKLELVQSGFQAIATGRAE